MSDELSEKYPEHAKLAAAADEHKHIQNFLDWLRDEYNVEGLVREQHMSEPSVDGRVQFDYLNDAACRDIIAAYLEVDEKVLEEERTRMIMMLRARH